MGQAAPTFVVMAAQVTLDDAGRDVLGHLAGGGVDWEAVVSYAEYHDVLPLVEKHLAGLQKGVVPPDVLGEVRDLARGVALRNLRQALELEQLTCALEDAGVPVIPFKGPVLAVTAYGDLAYRSAVDLDLLLQKDDFRRALAVVEGRGYAPRYREHTPEQRQSFIDDTGGYDLLNREKQVAIELHWKFFPEFNMFDFDTGSLWRRQQRVPFFNTTVRTLAPEDLLVYLCVHGTKHYWLKLKWMCDVAEHVRAHPDLNWEDVRRLAAEVGVQRVVRLSLLLVDGFRTGLLPASVRRWCEEDPPARRLAEQVRDEWILCLPPDRKATWWSRLWFDARERERWRDRIPFLLHNLHIAVWPSEKDRAFVRLPKALGVVYFLLRPVRLALDSLKRDR